MIVPLKVNERELVGRLPSFGKRSGKRSHHVRAPLFMSCASSLFSDDPAAGHITSVAIFFASDKYKFPRVEVVITDKKLDELLLMTMR